MSKPASSVEPFAPGQIVGKFEILTLLSSGGQAQVYLARVRHDGQLPFARVLRQMRWFGTTPEFIRAQQLCTIKLPLPRWEENLRDEHDYLVKPDMYHKHLARLLPEVGDKTNERRKVPKGLWFTTVSDSTGKSFDLPYIALTYEPGGSLKELLERRGRRPLPPAVAVAIALQVAEALDHLHTRGRLVHHDLSPSNIMFHRQLSPFRAQLPESILIDLAAADSPVAPRLRHIYGKKIYLAPERRSKAPKPIDWPVDVYGLGVVLYEMLAGNVPQSITTPTNELADTLPHIRERQPAISEALGKLVMQALEEDPARRPTLPELIQRLRDTPEASRPALLRGPWSARARWQAGVSALVAVLLVVLVSVAAHGGVGIGAGGGALSAPLVRPTSSGEPTITPLPSVTPTPSVTPVIPTSTPA